MLSVLAVWGVTFYLFHSSGRSFAFILPAALCIAYLSWRAWGWWCRRHSN